MDTVSALVSAVARLAVALDQAEAAYLAEKQRADQLAAGITDAPGVGTVA